MDVQALVELDTAAFERLVIDNAHPPARKPKIWAALTHPDLIDRTCETLTTLVQRNTAALCKRRADNLDLQQKCLARGAAGRKEWFEAKAEYDQWRRRASNFGRTAQNALKLAKETRKGINRAANHNVAQEHRERLRELALAVQKHQAAHAKAGGIADQADYELWRALDQIAVPIGPSSELTSLRTMLDIYWTDVTPVDEVEERRARSERAMRSAPAGQSAKFSGAPKARHVGNGKRLA
ncbi:hypothetical protein [Streptomyces nigrescens]|uniref:hypothetical protein n=1 Tax=Streptomyces nigrescens TaxID=1920 RepID=UPI0036FB1C2B